MKLTRYLWVTGLPRHCKEEDIQEIFQSHGKIQTIRIHEVNLCKGAIVAYINCKSSTKAYESVKTWIDVDYCEANGEPGITSLGKAKTDNLVGLYVDDKSLYRNISSSSKSNIFSFSLDDCSKYPSSQFAKRLDRGNSVENNVDKSGNRSPRLKNEERKDKACLNTDYRGLLVENLSQRSSDTSLREGLFHEYKKHGKITSVAVTGQGGGRHAIISFKRAEDMEKAFEASRGKIFFGNPIKAKKHNGFNFTDPDLCPPEHAMDEYHPKATKTLFVGKLESGSVGEMDLRKMFKKYGEIIDVDIKIQSNQLDMSFAFVQYYDIASVVRALRSQDAIKVDGKPVKLGFGKSQPTNCLWVGNLQRSADERFLRRHFKRFGQIALVVPDPEYMCSLVQFECAEDALRAFTDTRDRSSCGNIARRMQVDYAGNEYQAAFMDRLRRSRNVDGQDFVMNITDPYQTEKIQNLLISYTKCLGLLEESRSHSYDRYDRKSEYQENYEIYPCRQYRQRKPVHERLYNERYEDDEQCVNEYHYQKQKGRRYDDGSSSRSPIRYDRSSRRVEDELYGTNDVARSRPCYYKEAYYDNVVEASPTGYYPCRRSADTSYDFFPRNRNYSPSPTSSLDYYTDYTRHNLSERRSSRTQRGYRASHSRYLDLHCDRASSPFKRTPRQARPVGDEYGPFRSKIAANGRLRNIKCEFLRSGRPGECDQVGQQCSVSNGTNNRSVTTSTIADSSRVTVTTNTTSEAGNVTSVDVLSKLESERAKLLAELSLLSEDTSGGPGNVVNRALQSVVEDDCSDILGTLSKLKRSLSATPKVQDTNECSVLGVKLETTILEEKLESEDVLSRDRMALSGVVSDPYIRVLVVPTSTKVSTVHESSQSRDPRLNGTSCQQVSYPLPLILTESTEGSLLSGNKESNSDSDGDQFSNMDIEVDKRIRELDAKMIRSERTVRTMDYSKFRIRKRVCDGATACVTTTVTTTMTPLSSCAMTTSAGLLDIGYTHVSRDTGSNTSEFIKIMLNQTKQKSYLPLSGKYSPTEDMERETSFSVANDVSLGLTTSRNSCLPVTSVDACPKSMKSILKKSSSSVVPLTRHLDKVSALSPVLNSKTEDNAHYHTECARGHHHNHHDHNNIVLKRKIKSEPEYLDFKSHFKKSKNEYGPVFDDTLFQSYSTMPMKKIKRSRMNSMSTKKCQSSSLSVNNTVANEKVVTDRKETIKSKEKVVKTFREKKKSTNLKQSQMRNRKSKSNKVEKSKKQTYRKKEKVLHRHGIVKAEFEKEKEVDRGDDKGELEKEKEKDRGDDSRSHEYESMYDKIKRRNSNVNKMKCEKRRRLEVDDSESDVAEYWSANSRCKRARLSDVSSIHYSDSNSCKTTPCGKEFSDTTPTNAITKVECKAPAESLSVNSPHYSLYGSSPKSAHDITYKVAQCRSLHRPSDGPLKKRPITEPIVLSEDLPFLEKQSDDEYIVSGPMSVNDEPPAQLESMYDVSSFQPGGFLEELVVDARDPETTLEVDQSPLAADVNSASHILLTMKSQPSMEDALVRPDPDQQVQSVAEHLISLAHNSVHVALNAVCDKAASKPVMHESRPHLQGAVTVARPPRVSSKQDDEVTIYVKKIIDRIKQETDVVNSLTKDKLVCKRAKKNRAFNIPLSKSMLLTSLNHECRHILPIDIDSTSRLSSVTIGAVQPLTLSTVASSRVMTTTGRVPDKFGEVSNMQQSRQTQIEEKRLIKKVVASVIEKRLRHNSVKSDCQLQSLEETIDNVVKCSLSSSEADAVSVTDFDECKSLSNSYDSVNVKKPDMSSLERTMNEVISKMNAHSPSGSGSSLRQLPNHSNNVTSIKRHATSRDNRQHDRAVKSSNYGRITNLVLGIPSTMSLPTLVSQQTPLSLSVPPTQGGHSGTVGVPSTEMMFRQFNPLTPIVIQGSHRPPVNAAVDNVDSNLYIMMQRQTNPAHRNISNMSPTPLPEVLNGHHSIILSQIAHPNSVLTSLPLQAFANTSPKIATSTLYRPTTITASKFEEKDDWLNQNRQLNLNYPVRWSGKLCLKNDEVFVQMHMLAGNEDLIRISMNLISMGQVLYQPLKIVQRMRLEPNQLESLQKRLSRQLEFCTCLTLAGGDKADEVARTSSNMHTNFINYLQEKSAAGIINICTPDSLQNVYVIHIFPPCEFSDNQLKACSLKLYENLKEHSVPYLIIVITTV